MKRKIFLTSLPVEEALEKYIKSLEGRLVPNFEEIMVVEGLGRTTRLATFARYSSPLYNSAAMDGIAVLAQTTGGASESAPLRLKKEDYLVIDTGDPLPTEYDAVIMVEDTIALADGSVEIMAAAAPWQHVRPVGEDIVAGEMILPGRHKIRPIDIGVLLSGGVSKIEVYKRPSVAIYPTGTELIEPGTDPKRGDIIESNTQMFRGLVEENGGEGIRYPAVPDDYEKIKQAVIHGVKHHDMVIINAGSSAGTEDYTAPILRELGEVVVHGVAMKPGKPVILAIVDGKPVIGTPGYPVSAYLAYKTFVLPVLEQLTGRKPSEASSVRAVSARRLVSSLKHREYVRVKVGRVGDKLVALPMARGAGAAMSLVRADGFCVIPQESEGVEAGEEVMVELSRPLSEIERTLVSIGSHDLILDLLADVIYNEGGAFLASTHVGSMAGLMALLREETHIAPIHLMDKTTGEYNISYIKDTFKDQPMALIKGVGRTQGFIVSPGNPHNIKSVEDIPGLKYANRQRGAGTRILFDHQLEKAGIAPERINGYSNQMTTHMSVAAAVESGSCDVGMGILSAAKAMGLGFVPVGDEQYDFALKASSLENPYVKLFIKALGNKEFHRQVEELGGYTLDRIGEVVLVD